VGLFHCLPVRSVIIAENLGMLQEFASFDSFFELFPADKDVTFAWLFPPARLSRCVGYGKP
jgi:hypothetical protein